MRALARLQDRFLAMSPIFVLFVFVVVPSSTGRRA
jgi:hypothetical protein